MFDLTTDITLNKNRQFMRDYHTAPEHKIVAELYNQIAFTPEQETNIKVFGKDLVGKVRANKSALSLVQALMQKYKLSDLEGVTLMCLAESLLRIPDTYNANQLIQDKLRGGNFLGTEKSHSMFVNASAWGLFLTGRVLKLDDEGWSGILGGVTKSTSLPAIRAVVGQMMKILGEEFVMGESIESALKRAVEKEAKGYLYSYDMLGEGAVTHADSVKYFDEYMNALETIGTQTTGDNLYKRADISVKLSAIHPRYELLQADRIIGEIVPKVLELCKRAKHHGISMVIDAEEQETTEITIEIIKHLLEHPDLDGWNGLGYVVQAYGKRATYILDELHDMCRTNNRKIRVRLVKGAYWDSEVKMAQQKGLDDFPVFTRKEHTDVSYTVCAKKLFAYSDYIYPCFATHNALSVATVVELSKQYPNAGWEFQKLHGMGDYMYSLITEQGVRVPTRIYAPVGIHRDLLPYLVRRLLENGANSSFVNRIFDDSVSLDDMVELPTIPTKANKFTKHPRVQYPQDINNTDTAPHLWRKNSQGVNMTNIQSIKKLRDDMENYTFATDAFCIIDGNDVAGEKTPNVMPQDTTNTICTAHFADSQTCLNGLKSVAGGFESWNKTDVAKRAEILERAGDIFESRMADFVKLLSAEAGRTTEDAIDEVREAVDFLRYYAKHAQALLQKQDMTGPTGEYNSYQLSGRGVFLCISPWNFPLAIFMGQVAGALAVGNTVVAKPAESTPLVAYEAVKVLLQAGLPTDAIALLIAKGAMVGDTLVPQPNIAGVAFTGSTETAQRINITLAQRTDCIVPFIAETGGQNAMIVDSSALLEQATKDIVTGAFQSAGQRCSATRVVYVQDEVADKLLTMLSGAMAELKIGNPLDMSTDVGPVIDKRALDMLVANEQKMAGYTLVAQAPLPDGCKGGTFYPPTIYEIPSVAVLEREVFGPVLHVVRWDKEKLDDVIAEINGTGYGLTFGMHSRIDEKVCYVLSKIKAGNVYVNRNQIGAMVGQQPFGGAGKSGTGFKAGGPNYLLKFCHETTVSVDTTAAGGNASLMAEV